MKEKENSAELLKHLLNSVDLSDIDKLEKQELSDEEFYNRAADSEVFYKNHLEKVLKLLIQKQLEWMGTQIQNNDQLMFARGTINGLLLIQNWCEEQSNILKQKREEEKPKNLMYGVKDIK